jgi:tRNA pseudouridine55 synthase
MDGFLNLNKPIGFTSHDCVAKLRRILGTKKIGHAGTLDPAASGVLPVAIGRATRLLQYLPGDKAYKARIRFGVTTDSDDLDGNILTQTPAAQLTEDQIIPLLPQFQGTIDQIPPSYSAIQVDGKRLYDLARSGEDVIAPRRTVQVYQIDLLGWHPGDYPELDLSIACGSGTYIRSIARDLGAILGTGATLSALERTHSSGFDLGGSLSFEAVTAQREAQTLTLVHPEQAVVALSKLVLPDAIAQRWCWGQKIPLETISLPNADLIYRVHRESGEFLGIARGDGDILRPSMVYEPDSRF